MSMTIQQAIENRERCYKYLIGCGPKATTENVEAVRLSLEALREKSDREDPKPLTLEELQKMVGEPVWMVWPDNRIRSRWWIVGSHEWYMMEFDDPNMVKRYGSVWVAYRHKPREVTK